jgi:uncharacterized membrane protein
VEQAVHEAEQTTGLQFCVYLGSTEEDSRAHAEELFVAAGLHARPAVLLLVAPPQRRVEVVTAPAVRSRLDDAACASAVEEMTQLFARGQLAGGIVAGVRHLAATAGPGTPPPDGDELPDVLEG